MKVSDTIKGITLDDIYEFIDNGNPDEAPIGIITYLDLMDKVRSMHLRVAHYGTKESILNHLIKVEGLSRYLASNLYYNTLEYFYASSQLSKQAQRNVYADKIDRQIAIAELAIKDVKDAKAVTAMIMDAYKARGLDKDEIEQIPEEWLKKQFVLYTTEAITAGLDPINRIELKKQIDSYPDLTEKEKKMLYRESLIEDIIIFPDDQENPRKNK